MDSSKPRLIEILIACSDLFDNAFGIADMEQPDQPAIHVNKLFETITGYSREETVGRNFRLLQGALTSQEAVRHIRTAIQDQSAVHVDIVNYKKDGTPFWNRMVILPLREDGHLFYLGMQLDVSKRKQEIIGKSVAKLTLPEATPHQIYHEIRNPLSVVTNAYLLMHDSPPEHSEQLSRMLRRAVVDIASYVQNLPWTPAN